MRMANTTYNDVLSAFESSFQDKYTIQPALIYEWFNKAVGMFSLELWELSFDADAKEFDKALPQNIVNCLSELMKMLYQERELSRINKLNNIVGKDLAFNSTGDAKKATKLELDYLKMRADEILHKLKQPAY
jgi:hypothetical protein